MNFLDRAIAFFNPNAGLQRARARTAIRIYEGAQVGRRSSSWKALHTSQNAEQMYAIRPLRDRARDLVRNTPHATRMLDILTSHTIGNGIIPVSATGRDKLDKQVKQLWDDWQENCDVTDRLDFYALQALACRSMVESGEVVFRFLDREMDDNLPVPLQLQILEADYIDQFRDGLFNISRPEKKIPGVLRSRLGVGLGQFDRFMGLWLFRYHPGELNTIWQQQYISDFIPADELIHIFKILRPGQVRGVPWMAPILTTARDMSDFMDAVNVKARVEACFTAFVTNDDATGGGLFDPSQEGVLQTADFANPNANVTTLEPGMIKELRTGQDIKFASPTGTTQIDPILYNDLAAMAAGVGCTYDQISGDLRQANYSSLRAGKLDFWRLIKQLQSRIIIPRLCKPVWQRFISRAILAGELRNIPGGYPVDWVVPALEYIDPKKDADAEKNEVRSGRVTPQAYIAARGGNWREDLQDFADFFEKAHELGVTLDIDVGKVDQHGRQPSKGGGGKFGEGDGADEDTMREDIESERDEGGGDDGERGGPSGVIPFPPTNGSTVDQKLLNYGHRDAESGKTQDHDPATGQFIGNGGGSGAGVSGGQGQGQAGAGGGAARRGGARSPEEAQRSAAEAAAGYPKLTGLPDKPIKIGDAYYVPGPFGKAKEAAARYMRDAGLAYDPPAQYLKVDKERATRIANAFDAMKHNPDSEAVQASYEALANETIAQWHAIKATGLKVEWIKPGQPDPYAATPRLAAMDVIENNHWWGFPTDGGFGSGAEAEAARHNNPMLKMTDEYVDGRRLMVNDVFRIVHDYFGHFKEGVGFRADGEENAWRSHSAMYSDLARGAMTSETRGQNSWVNYGPYGETNRTASAGDTHYAPQKIGLMPEWTWNEGRKDPKRAASDLAQRDAESGKTQDHDPATGEFVGDGGSSSSVTEAVAASHSSATKYKAKKTAAEKAAKAAAQQELSSTLADTSSTQYLRLTGDSIKGEIEKREGRTASVPQVAKELNARANDIWKQMGIKSGKVTLETTTPQLDDILANILAEEIKNGLKTGQEQADWYNKTMHEAMRIATVIHPEIAKDPIKKFAFITSLAVTSQGQTVGVNASKTEEAYAVFEKTGRFPTDLEISKPSINDNFKKINKLIDANGGDATKVAAFFDKRMPAGDLQALLNGREPGSPGANKDKIKLGSINVDTLVYGSACLGPKIGEGFYQNLNGNFKPVTVDMWFMRTWGRITGTGIGGPKPDWDRFKDALKAAGREVPQSEDKLLALATQIKKENDAAFKQLTPKEIAAGSKRVVKTASDKTELDHAATRLVLAKTNGMVCQPQGGTQRAWMTKVFVSATEKLRAEGISIEPAAAQATIWNPEKVLYSHLGARTPEEADYAKTLRAIAQAKGIAV